MDSTTQNTTQRPRPSGDRLANMPYENFCRNFGPEEESPRIRTATIGLWSALAVGFVTVLAFGGSVAS